MREVAVAWIGRTTFGNGSGRALAMAAEAARRRLTAPGGHVQSG